MTDADRKRELYGQLDSLRREYAKRAEPLVHELADIIGREPPEPLIFPVSEISPYLWNLVRSAE